jgi:hypothetical protein
MLLRKPRINQPLQKSAKADPSLARMRQIGKKNGIIKDSSNIHYS